jgi:hypothetical protein
MIYNMSFEYWIAVWLLMGIAVIVVWVAIIVGSMRLDCGDD